MVRALIVLVRGVICTFGSWFERFGNGFGQPVKSGAETKAVNGLVWDNRVPRVVSSCRRRRAKPSG